ncbi:MAG: hypothetical protein RL291_795, partial [Pseudomonadota bacterium]
MATKADRGTKRTCQNSDCGSRFYDLNRSPISCPVCQTAFVFSEPSTPVVAEVKVARPVAKPEFELADGLKPDDVPEGEEVLADIEAADDTIVGEDDETFLEEEEEDQGNVSGIVGGPGET